MNKKTYTIIGIAAVILVIAGSILIVVESKAKPTKILAQCTLKDDSPNLKISASDEQNISIAASNYITNVPAGTNVSVDIKSYNGSTTAGSAIYAGTYGSYNFTATKNKSIHEPSNQLDWDITSFVPCRR